MRIVSVHLRNIKSHSDKELLFSPGINVLSGANGSGKSTIFEAIGYALFGVDAKDFVSNAERFLTIGAKRGEIAVVFEAAPGESYRVTRTVGAAGKWLLAKEVGGEFEVEEHANMGETEARIAKLLGLSAARPLSEQFKLVIGPFQNDFLGPFVIKQPTRRQEAFDEILGIDAWRKTQDKTKVLTSAIKAKLDVLHAEVDSKSEQVAALAGKEEELAALRVQGEAKKAELEVKLAEQERVTALVQDLEGGKERLLAVQKEMQELEVKSASGREYIAGQQLQVEQSLKAAAVVAEAAAGKDAYDAAESKLKRLREEEQQKHLLERKLAELEKEQGSLQATLGAESRQLREMQAAIEADAKALAEAEQAQSRALEELRRAEALALQGLEAAERSRRLFRELPVHGVETTLPYLNATLDRLKAIDEQTEERQKAVAGSEASRAAAEGLAVLQGRLEKVQAERSELSGRKLSLAEGREKIGSGSCPFFLEPCQNLKGSDPAGLFDSRVAALDSDMAALDQQAAELAAHVAAAQQAARDLAGMEQVHRELAKAGLERQKLEDEFSRTFAQISPSSLLVPLEQWLQNSGFAVSFLEGAPAGELDFAASPQSRRDALLAAGAAWQRIIARVDEAVADRVKQAGEPVQECAKKLAELSARGEAQTAKRCELAAAREKAVQREQGMEQHAARLTVLQGEIAARKGDLAPHDGIESAIKEASDELVRFQGARDEYIANQKAAEELGKRQELLARYQARLAELSAALVEKQDEREKRAAEYDAEQHEKAKANRDELLSAVATLKSEIGSIAEGVTRLEGELTALRAVAAEIEQKRLAIEKLKEQAELVKFLRNQVFKNVSAQLSERFREEISFRADRIYRGICESDEELFWGDNYQIVLKDMPDGVIRERTDDQLSGGQMMSAVVALRLALLQTIGARIAFFDEPTSNLDAERRENLAKAFRAIDVGQEEVTEHWYDQLFLVSHDVSFTEITDQTIQLD